MYVSEWVCLSVLFKSVWCVLFSICGFWGLVEFATVISCFIELIRFRSFVLYSWFETILFDWLVVTSLCLFVSGLLVFVLCVVRISQLLLNMRASFFYVDSLLFLSHHLS